MRSSFAATRAAYEKKTAALREAEEAVSSAEAQINRLKKAELAAVSTNAMVDAANIKRQKEATQGVWRKLDATLKTARTAQSSAEQEYQSEERQLASLEEAVSSLELLAAKARLLITEVRLRLAHMNAKYSKSATYYLDALTWQTQEKALKKEKSALMSRYRLQDPARALEAKMAANNDRNTRSIGSKSTDAYQAEFQELHDVLWAYIGKSAKGHRLIAQRNRPFWLSHFELKTESQELDKLATQAMNAERDVKEKESLFVAKQKAYTAAEQNHAALRAKEVQAGTSGHFDKAKSLKKKVEVADGAVNKARAEMSDAAAQLNAANKSRTLYAKGLSKYEELLEVVERVCARFTKDALQDTVKVSETALPEAILTESWALASKLKAAQAASTKMLDKLMKVRAFALGFALTLRDLRTLPCDAQAYIFADTTGENALPDGQKTDGLKTEL